MNTVTKFFKKAQKKPSFAGAVIFYILAVVAAAAFAAIFFKVVGVDKLPKLPSPLSYKLVTLAAAGLFLVIAVIINIAVAAKRKNVLSFDGICNRGVKFGKKFGNKKYRDNAFSVFGKAVAAFIPLKLIASARYKRGARYKKSAAMRYFL